MSDYFFTNEQTDQIEAAYSKITLSRYGAIALFELEQFKQLVTGIIVKNMQESTQQRLQEIADADAEAMPLEDE